MFLLIVFAFLAGVVTILSPCILPILPIILSGSATGGKSRPIGIIAGFILSFTFFTLFLSTLVSVFRIPADSLRSLSILVLGFFGVSLLWPGFQLLVERLFSALSSKVPTAKSDSGGFFSGILVGLSLGLLWTPCVGPILASVISLALTGSVSFQALLITLAYSVGTAIPMFGIMVGGRALLVRLSLLKHTIIIQRIFGVIMLATSVSIAMGLDRSFQSFILEKFPDYGVGLTRFEDTEVVKSQLDELSVTPIPQITMGAPMGVKPSQFPKAPELVPGGQWFNLPDGQSDLRLSSLRGKVVLIDFWTYTCINCIRTLPYLRDWHSKYLDSGLVIIGVHTPEFEFEKSAENVRTAISDYELKYPIVQDNFYSTWKAYSNRYWPAKYLIDKDGLVRYYHFGEGEYDETEAEIQKLLKEINPEASTTQINNTQYSIQSKTPEIYLGTDRFEDEFVIFSGQWKRMKEYSLSQGVSVLDLSFNSKKVYLVARPEVPGTSGQIKVFLDPDAGNGLTKTLDIDSDKIYELIDLPVAGPHKLRLELSPGIEIYAFTFG